MDKKKTSAEFENLDPNSLNKEFSLRFEYYSTAGGKSKKYVGHIDTILDFGVSVKTRETCAKGHNVSFEIFKDKRKLLDGTGKIETVREDAGADLLVDVICSFNQFSEQDKKLLQQEAELSQDGINDFMEDLN